MPGEEQEEHPLIDRDHRKTDSLTVIARRFFHGASIQHGFTGGFANHVQYRFRRLLQTHTETELDRIHDHTPSGISLLFDEFLKVEILAESLSGGPRACDSHLYVNATGLVPRGANFYK